MTREEFREQMKELIALEILTRTDPEKHQEIIAKRTKLSQEYRKSLYEETIKNQETEVKRRR